MPGGDFFCSETALEFGPYPCTQFAYSDGGSQPVQMVAVKGNRLRNRFTVGGEPFRRRYRLYPIYRGKGDLGTVGLNFRVPIGCRRSRLLLGGNQSWTRFSPVKPETYQ